MAYKTATFRRPAALLLAVTLIVQGLARVPTAACGCDADVTAAPPAGSCCCGDATGSNVHATCACCTANGNDRGTEHGCSRKATGNCACGCTRPAEDPAMPAPAQTHSPSVPRSSLLAASLDTVPVASTALRSRGVRIAEPPAWLSEPRSIQLLCCIWLT